MWRYYLVPDVSLQGAVTRYRQPAYVKGRVVPDGLDVPWGALPWGRDARFLLGAEVDASQHLDLSGRAGVTALPIDDRTALSTADQTRLTQFCEAVGLPSAWISNQENGKALAKAFTGIALIIQRFNGRARAPLEGQLGLAVRDLTPTQRDHLLEVMNDFGLSRDGITADSTIGQLLLTWGRQWASRDVFVSGRTL